MDAEASAFVVGAIAGVLIAWVWLPQTDNSWTFTLFIVGGALGVTGLATWAELLVVADAVEKCPDGPIGEACAAAGAGFLVLTKASGVMILGGGLAGGVTAYLRYQKLTRAAQNANSSIDGVTRAAAENITSTDRVTRSDAARMFGVTTSRLRGMESRGDITPRRNGRRVMLDPNEVASALGVPVP